MLKIKESLPENAFPCLHLNICKLHKVTSIIQRNEVIFYILRRTGTTVQEVMQSYLSLGEFRLEENRGDKIITKEGRKSRSNERKHGC